MPPTVDGSDSTAQTGIPNTNSQEKPVNVNDETKNLSGSDNKVPNMAETSAVGS